MTTADPRVFEWLADDLEEARLRALSRLTLDGRKVDIRVADALRDVQVERSITGASRVTITLLDPDMDLLASDLFQHSVEVGIVLDRRRQRLGAAQAGVTVEDDDPLRFRLERWSSPDRTLGLECVDREVALLKAYDDPRHASRRNVTRAEFAQMLVREVKGERIPFWSPELHAKQPIRREKDRQPTSREEAERKRGLSKSDRVKVKGSIASAAQLRVLEAVIETGASMEGVTKSLLIMGVMCVTQESGAANLGDRTVQGPSGPQVIRGAFQQSLTIGGKRTNWPASRDVARDARGFFRALLPVYRRYSGTGKSFGELIDRVQGAGTPGAYDHWHDEATVTVNEWSGGTGFTSTGGTRYVKRYQFRRGEPGQRENSWDAMQRLAEEVRWRCFVDRGVVFFVSDDYLRQGRVRLRITRGDLPPGIDVVRIGDVDAARRAATAEIDAFIGQWLPPLGGMVELEDYGVASGRYLIEGTSGSLLSPKWTVTLTRPLSALKEPAAERVAVGAGGGRGVALSAGGGRGIANAIPGSPVPGIPPHAPTHETAGLAGYPAYDYMAPPGTPVVSPVGGRIRKLSGHSPALGGPPGGPLGYNIYVAGGGNDYFLTHVDRVMVRVGQMVQQGEQIAVVANGPPSWSTPHCHMGVHHGYV